MDYTVIHPTNKNNGVRGGLSSHLTTTGHVPMRHGQWVRFEGLYEQEFLETIDFHPYIQAVWPQPLQFRLHDIPGKTKYTPDYLVEFSRDATGNCMRPMLVEVKTRSDLKESRDELIHGFRATVDFCKKQNWRFRVATDVLLARPYSVNARFLRSYLNDEYDPDIAKILVLNLRKFGSAPVSRLLEASFEDFDDRLRALAVTWHLLATRQFETKLILPLNNNSVIWEAGHGTR